MQAQDCSKGCLTFISALPEGLLSVVAVQICQILHFICLRPSGVDVSTRIHTCGDLCLFKLEDCALYGMPYSTCAQDAHKLASHFDLHGRQLKPP